jgi:hypothetical protein
MRTLTKKRLTQINDDLWSLIVRTRDNYICEFCHTKTKHTEAHHIIGKDNKSVRWDIQNGISLCYYHHRFWIHGGKMTDEKRIEFYESILGDEYDELKIRARRIVKFNLDFCKEEFVRLYNIAVEMGLDVSKIVPKYVTKELFQYVIKELLEVK